ncbi:MAG: methyltransferase domain-containing protein [Dehalococcoidales bacterium]|nr:MAG: methyltransferase domain-containing protein [Dehalococcoidales bacterium]
MSKNPVIQGSYDMNALREPVLHTLINELNLPKGSHGLDNACGIGLQAIVLAGEVGSNGHVTGLDISTEIIDIGRKIIEDAGLSERVSLQQGDIATLPFENGTFDWALSIDGVGYGPGNNLHYLGEMKRVVKSGGMVAIAAWSSEKLLPGYPELEARLGATTSGIAPFVRGKNPELHLSRTLGQLWKLGLTETVAKTYAGSVFAPFDETSRRALVSLFEMRWPNVEAELSDQDVYEFKRLCNPDSRDFILNIPEYYAYFTYTVFRGTKL